MTPEYQDANIYTEFYPANILPFRIGVYEVILNFVSNIPYYAYWDGEKFCFWGRSPKEAKRYKDIPTQAWRYKFWRGLRK